MVQPRRSARFSGRCPRCQAAPGWPCRNAEGQILTGPHWEREQSRRRANLAAIEFCRMSFAGVSRASVPRGTFTDGSL